MVKPTRNFPLSEDCPQFFKIYFPDHCSQRLRIPSAFVEQLNGDLPYNSIITSLAKGSWRVDVNKVDENMYFENGWLEFVRGNALEFGDFLIFYYVGSSEFFVKIFGRDGCQKIPAKKGRKKHAVFRENQTFKHEKSKQLMLEDNGNGVTNMSLRPRVPLAIQLPEKDIKEANGFVSAHPFFKVSITSTSLKKGFMNIPKSFFRSYVDEGRESAFLRVSDELWPVKLAIHGNRIARFCQGWRSFVRENTLQVGNVCIFELVRRKDFVLKVVIFRCLEG